jgi:Predicted membrane protein
MPLIMVGQNLQGRHSETRAELDFQVNLKNEISITEVLRRLDVLESERLPLLFAQQNERIDDLKPSSSAKATNAN